MLSLIEVKCPHCGAQGQIMLPPLGAIVVGPCPECQGMVAVFCGRVLPLDREVIFNGTADEKRDHLMDVLGRFIENRVERLFDGILNEADAPDGPPEDSAAAHGHPLGEMSPFGNSPKVPISATEVDSFRNVDLKLIDNAEYFKAVFD